MVTVELSFDGSFSYTPHEGFAGTDTFTYIPYFYAFPNVEVGEPTTVTITVGQTGSPEDLYDRPESPWVMGAGGRPRR